MSLLAIAGQEHPLYPKVDVRQYDDARSLYNSHADERDHFVSSHWWRSTLLGRSDSRTISDAYDVRNGVSFGDLILPQVTERSLIQLRESHGVFERSARRVPLQHEMGVIPLEEQAASHYWIENEHAITESEMLFGAAEVHLRKLGVLLHFTSDLAEDSVVDLAEVIENSIAIEFAKAIDDAAFNGDGTSAYGHQTGAAHALHSNAVHTASVNAPADLTQEDWEQAAQLLQRFEGEPSWYMHPAIYHRSCLADHSGLCSVDQGRRYFMGYPVEFVNVMPSTVTSSPETIVAYLGSIRQSAIFGYKRELRVALSENQRFEFDSIACRVTQRLCVNWHARGESQRSRAFVALKTSS